MSSQRHPQNSRTKRQCASQRCRPEVSDDSTLSQSFPNRSYVPGPKGAGQRVLRLGISL